MWNGYFDAIVHISQKPVYFIPNSPPRYMLFRNRSMSSPTCASWWVSVRNSTFSHARLVFLLITFFFHVGYLLKDRKITCAPQVTHSVAMYYVYPCFVNRNLVGGLSIHVLDANTFLFLSNERMFYARNKYQTNVVIYTFLMFLWIK